MRNYAWVAVALVCCASVVVMAADTVTVQGLLKGSDGVPLVSGTYAMQFSLYAAASGGTAEWTETHSADAAVTVTAGLYSAELGLSAAFPATLFSANPDLRLEVAVDTSANGLFETDEVFAPRMKLTSAPYAHQAKNAQALQGQPASAFASATHTHDGAAIVSGVVAEGVIDGVIARDAEVATAISTHAGVANAHHTWPLTDAEVPDDITVSASGSVDGGAIKTGTVAEARISSAVARVSQVAPRQFDAVVAPSGGDYTTIQAALGASKKTIFVRKGTYVLTSDINITQDGTAIIGENREGVIIDCNNTAYGIKAIGDTANYTAGTVAITNNTNTVTGTGTSWSGNVAAGEYIQLGGDWLKIQSVDSNAQLTLVDTYYGGTLSGVSYKIAGMLTNIRLENLTVQRYNQSSQGGINFEWVLNCVIQNCSVNDNLDYGIYLKETYHGKLNKSFAQRNAGGGIFMTDSSHNALCENSCTNNSGIAIHLMLSSNNKLSENACANSYRGIFLYVSPYNSVSGNSCDYNFVTGIYVDASSDNNAVCGNACRGNAYDGIRLESSDTNTLVGNISAGNGDYGINIFNSACDNNIVTSNQLSNNTSGAGNDASGGDTIKANNYPSF